MTIAVDAAIQVTHINLPFKSAVIKKFPWNAPELRAGWRIFPHLGSNDLVNGTWEAGENPPRTLKVPRAISRSR